MENEEVIRERMEKTREDLSEKLETLEDRLVGSVEGAASAVREAVSGVKETMHEGVESVKDAVNVQAHVKRRPWLMFGGAVLGGYALGTLLLREEGPAFTQAPTSQPRRPQFGNGHAKQQPRPEPAASESCGLLKMVEPEIRQLKGLALGVTLGTVRELLTREVPEHLADELRSIVDGMTRKLGGEPIPASDLPFAEPAAGQAESQGSPVEGERPRW